jgi:hypothetical protein
LSALSRPVRGGPWAVNVATFNVNGITARLPPLLGWLAETLPGVVCLQELNASDERLPAAASVREADSGRALANVRFLARCKRLQLAPNSPPPPRQCLSQRADFANRS